MPAVEQLLPLCHIIPHPRAPAAGQLLSHQALQDHRQVRYTASTSIFFLFFFLHTSFIHFRKFGSPYTWVQKNRHKSPPVLQVCAVFLLYLCVQTAWLPCTVFGIFNMRPNGMHATAHRHYTNTVRESALRVDSESKIPCHTREWNRHQYCSQLFGLMLHHLSHPVPLLVAIVVFMPRLLDFSCQQKGSDV